MRFGEPELPRNASVLDGRQRRRAGAAIVSGDQNHVGVRLRHAGRDGADAQLGDQLHADARLRVCVLQIVDQFGEILDRVDIVVRRRRNESDAGRRVAHLRDRRVHFHARKLSAFAGFRALGDLDLQLAGVDEIVRGHAEAAARHLLDGGIARVAVAVVEIAGRIFAALAGVRFTADAVHGDGERLVRFFRNAAIRHRPGLEPLQDALDRLDFIDAHRLGGRAEIHQTTQRAEIARLVVD